MEAAYSQYKQEHYPALKQLTQNLPKNRLMNKEPLLCSRFKQDIHFNYLYLVSRPLFPDLGTHP